MKPYYSFTKTESVLLLILSVILVVLTLAAGWIIGIMVRSESDQGNTEIRGQAAPLPSGLRNIPGVAETGQASASVTSAKRNMAALIPVSETGGGKSPPSQDSKADTRVPSPAGDRKAEDSHAGGTAPAPSAEAEAENSSAQGTAPAPSAAAEAKDSHADAEKNAPVLPAQVKTAPKSLPQDRKTQAPEYTPLPDSAQFADESGGFSADTQKKDKPESSDVRFCLITDTFVVKTKALTRVSELREKGYTGTSVLCFPSSDRDNNIMNYLIQIGSYESLSAANLAASEFWEKEKSLAVIRPISLFDLKEKLMKPESREEGK